MVRQAPTLDNAQLNNDVKDAQLKLIVLRKKKHRGCLLAAVDGTRGSDTHRDVRRNHGLCCFG